MRWVFTDGFGTAFGKNPAHQLLRRFGAQPAIRVQIHGAS